VVAILLVPRPALAQGSRSDHRTVDPRSQEILRYECKNELGRRDITLFGNGTIRVRDGHWDDQSLELDELGPDELQEVIDALESVDIDSPAPPPSLNGRWSRDCRVRLALPGKKPWEITYSAWALPPVAVSRVIQVAEDLAAHVQPAVRVDHLPKNYEPRAGDYLRDRDGKVWMVLRYTTDRRGLELQGRDEPLRIFVALDQLDETFSDLVRDPRDQRQR